MYLGGPLEELALAIFFTVMLLHYQHFPLMLMLCRGGFVKGKAVLFFYYDLLIYQVLTISISGTPSKWGKLLFKLAHLFLEITDIIAISKGLLR